MITKEIGGYFGLEEFSGQEYHPGLLGLNTARNALEYLIRAKKIRKLLLPAFLCDCVWRVCQRCGCQWEFYSIDENLLPKIHKLPEDGTWLYVVNYYGQLSDNQILQLKRTWDNLIIDHVQDFFRKPLPGIDTLYSCRKFFGVPDGAYLSTDAQLPELLPQDISCDRMGHVLGRFEHNASAFYSAFQSSDESFYALPLARMSLLTQNILRAVDYELVRRKRNENYQFLHQQLGENNRLTLIAPDGPYCYPFYTHNGRELKKKLAAEKIYVPTLWPDLPKSTTSFEQDLAENILPLPCDQRYSLENMEHLLHVLRTHL